MTSATSPFETLTGGACGVDLVNKTIEQRKVERQESQARRVELLERLAAQAVEEHSQHLAYGVRDCPMCALIRELIGSQP